MSGITADLAQSPAPVKKRGKIRRVIGVVLIAVVLFLMVSTLIVMRQRIESADEAAGAIYNHVLWNNLIIGIAFLITAIGIGFDILKKSRVPALRITGYAIWGISAVVSMITMILCGQVLVAGLRRDAQPDARHIVVLSEPLQSDNSLSASLSDRLETAANWYKSDPENVTQKQLNDERDAAERAAKQAAKADQTADEASPDETDQSTDETAAPDATAQTDAEIDPARVKTVIIVTGADAFVPIVDANDTNDPTQTQTVKSRGNPLGSGSKKRERKNRVDSEINTEADQLAKKLHKDLDIPTGVIQKESSGKDPDEIFRNLLDNEEFGLEADTPIVIVTTEYEMYRAVRAAQDAGFTNVSRLPSFSGFLSFGADLTFATWLQFDPVVRDSGVTR